MLNPKSPNRYGVGNTPLHDAAMFGSVQVMREFLGRVPGLVRCAARPRLYTSTLYPDP